MIGQRMPRRNQPANGLRSRPPVERLGGGQGFGQFSIATRMIRVAQIWPNRTVAAWKPLGNLLSVFCSGLSRPFSRGLISRDSTDRIASWESVYCMVKA